MSCQCSLDMMDGAVAWHWWHVGHSVSLVVIYAILRLPSPYPFRFEMFMVILWLQNLQLGSVFREDRWHHILQNIFYQNFDLEWSYGSTKGQSGLATFASISYVKVNHGEINTQIFVNGLTLMSPWCHCNPIYCPTMTFQNQKHKATSEVQSCEIIEQ